MNGCELRRHTSSCWPPDPIVGTLIAVLEIWIASAHLYDPWISIILATMGGTVAMIGPGAWSIDARLFGRNEYEQGRPAEG
jgi:hypothetical protein